MMKRDRERERRVRDERKGDLVNFEKKFGTSGGLKHIDKHTHTHICIYMTYVQTEKGNAVYRSN